MSMPTLVGSRLVLRPVADGDAAALLALFGDAERMRFWGHAPLASREEAVAYIDGIRRGAAEGTLFQWALSARRASAEEEAPTPPVSTASGATHARASTGASPLLGTCSLADIDPTHRRAGLGVALLPEAVGRGLATEAAGMAIRYAFQELGLHRIVADADPRNGPALALLERLGFRREGVLREHYRHGEEWQDGVVYGLLNGESANRDADAATSAPHGRTSS